MTCSIEDIAVFTETNLGTRIGMEVSPDITAGDFKKELESRHFKCFPKIGEIRVFGLMVKRKSSFYHLPNSMPIKHVFLGLKGAWFLRVEAKPLSELDASGLSPFIDAKLRDHNVIFGDATDSLIAGTEKNGIINNGKKGRTNGSHVTTSLPKELSRNASHSSRTRKKEKRVEFATECNSNQFVEIPSEKASYNFSEMSKPGSPAGANATSITVQYHIQKQARAKRNATYTNIQINALSRLMVKNPPRTLSFPLSTNLRLATSRNEPVTEVGKRLVKAAKNIGYSACNSSPAISFCRFKNGKLLHNSVSSLSQYLVFEISDNDD